MANLARLVKVASLNPALRVKVAPPNKAPSLNLAFSNPA